MLIQTKILDENGNCIAHQPRISLRLMCRQDYLPGLLGIKQEDIIPLELGEEKILELEEGYRLVVRRIL